MSWLVALIIPALGVVAVFTFVAVAAWSDNRRKERETFYRHETYRRMLEQPGEAAREVLALMRREELEQRRRLLEGMRLGGLITLAVGVGVMVFLYFLIDGPVYLAGLIPLLVGVVLAIYGFSMTEKAQGGGGQS